MREEGGRKGGNTEVKVEGMREREGVKKERREGGTEGEGREGESERVKLLVNSQEYMEIQE